MDRKDLEGTAVIIYSALLFNDFRFTTIKNSFINEIPRISIGRQKGHSTALMAFIRDHPNLLFGVIGVSNIMFNAHYKSIKNVCNVNLSSVDAFRHKGRCFNYLIVEQARHFVSVPDNITKFNTFIEQHAASLNGSKPRMMLIGN